MPGVTMVLALATVMLSSLGQLLLKAGARHLAGRGSGDFLAAAVTDVRVLSGLLAWAASTLCWLYVLRVARLSSVYGLLSLTYVLVPLASVCFFGEQVRRAQLAGMALIVLGIVCMLAGD